MSKLLIASNRLPVKLSKTEEGYHAEASEGGLATGLKSYHKNNNSLWIGWPGVGADTPSEEKEIGKELAKEQCLPVFLEDQLFEDYYEGFSNATLWPLYHYFTEYATFKGCYWEAYKKVNVLFAEKIMENLQDGDTVWVHDYQLMLVPQLIKDRFPEVKIGFFLHIPFPSYEVFRILPWREELLQGVLGADLIGFHTYDYARHFKSSVKRLLGYDVEFSAISTERGLVYVDVFPMGIDYDKFYNKAVEIQSKAVQDRSKEHQDIDRFLLNDNSRKLILSIDRLDYTKGIPHRIKAFRRFLIEHPEYKEKVSLIMLTVPSREQVGQYQSLKSEIEELVGSVNGEFGTLNWNPIIYFYRSLPFNNLIELYSSADVALLTPLRDGMNLVAKEFVATKVNQKGVLVLSEMTGASKELGEAITVNPNNIRGVAEAIYQALSMSVEEQQSSIHFMQKRIKRYDIHKWASEFIQSLDKIGEKQAVNQARRVSKHLLEKFTKVYKSAEKRILFLDYDGTLQAFFNNPNAAKPDEDLLALLATISKDAKNELVLISGRDKTTLEAWFAGQNISLIAEHGVWYKAKDGDWEHKGRVNTDWMESIRPVLESYVDRTPGSFIEEKSQSLVWHYRKSDIELGVLRSLEMKLDLSSLIANQELEMLEGSKVIEVKTAGVNKGGAALDFLQGREADFILAIGDDWTDEYLFKELPDSTLSIKVGTDKSEASYYVDNYKQVRSLLQQVIA